MNRQDSAVQGETVGQPNFNPKLLNHHGILQYLPVPVILCNVDGIITYFNDEAAVYCGSSLANGISYQDGWKSCKLFCSDETPVPEDQLSALRFIQSGLPSRQLVFVIEKSDLSRMPV